MPVACYMRNVPSLHGRVTTLWEKRIPEGRVVFGRPPRNGVICRENPADVAAWAP
jgi:hypothetical protein